MQNNIHSLSEAPIILPAKFPFQTSMHTTKVHTKIIPKQSEVEFLLRYWMSEITTFTRIRYSFRFRFCFFRLHFAILWIIIWNMCRILGSSNSDFWYRRLKSFFRLRNGFVSLIVVFLLHIRWELGSMRNGRWKARYRAKWKEIEEKKNLFTEKRIEIVVTLTALHKRKWNFSFFTKKREKERLRWKRNGKMFSSW